MTIKKYAFVLMPFSDDFTDIYKLGIKNACKELDIYCERVDEQYYEGSMLDRIYNQIQKADYIIADMTGKNPNVFYEVGYAHGLGKSVILITQDGDDIPFDMKHFLHIIYSKSNISELNTKLMDRLKWYVENGDNAKTEFPLSVYINDTQLACDTETIIEYHVDASSIHYTSTHFYINYSNILVRLHNTSSQLLSRGDIHMGIVIHHNSLGDFKVVKDKANECLVSRLPSQSTLFDFQSIASMYPNQWNGIEMVFSNSVYKAEEQVESFEVKGYIYIQMYGVVYACPFVYKFIFPDNMNKAIAEKYSTSDT